MPWKRDSIMNKCYIFYLVDDWEASSIITSTLQKKKKDSMWAALRHAVMSVPSFLTCKPNIVVQLLNSLPGYLLAFLTKTDATKNQSCSTVISGGHLQWLHLNYSNVHWSLPSEDALCEAVNCPNQPILSRDRRYFGDRIYFSITKIPNSFNHQLENVNWLNWRVNDLSPKVQQPAFYFSHSNPPFPRKCFCSA
jgi:hypothetical protein